MDKEAVAFVYSGILFSHKKKEIFPFVTTWMDFKGIMLCEISQTERDNKYDLSYMWNIKQTKNPEAHRHREQIGDCCGER